MNTRPFSLRDLTPYKNIDDLWKIIDMQYEAKLRGYKGKWSVELERLDHNGRTFCVVYGRNEKLNHEFIGMMELTMKTRPSIVANVIIDMVYKSAERDIKGTKMSS